MMNTPSKRSFSNAVLFVSVIFLAACGGEENDEGNTSATDSVTANKTADGKLNINTATGDGFRSIPDVGDKMVHEFEEYRPYVSIQQFRKEIGKYVDEDRVAALEERIYVPISRNDSDAETLMQIPGLDDGEAEGVVKARPYQSDKMFLDALKSYISDEELATAQELMKAE
jgi:DNA uptake protein ComE-like DNA-binding protein